MCEVSLLQRKTELGRELRSTGREWFHLILIVRSEKASLR